MAYVLIVGSESRIANTNVAGETDDTGGNRGRDALHGAGVRALIRPLAAAGHAVEFVQGCDAAIAALDRPIDDDDEATWRSGADAIPVTSARWDFWASPASTHFPRAAGGDRRSQLSEATTPSARRPRPRPTRPLRSAGAPDLILMDMALLGRCGIPLLHALAERADGARRAAGSTDRAAHLPAVAAFHPDVIPADAPTTRAAHPGRVGPCRVVHPGATWAETERRLLACLPNDAAATAEGAGATAKGATAKGATAEGATAAGAGVERPATAAVHAFSGTAGTAAPSIPDGRPLHLPQQPASPFAPRREERVA